MASEPKCEHVNFKSTVKVTRVTHDVTGNVIAHAADIAIECADCGTPFWFPGLGTGVSWMEPVTSTDGFEMRAPIVPANVRHQPDPSLVSVKVTTPDSYKGHRL